MKDKIIGFGLTGSYCTLQAIIEPLRILRDRGYSLIPILSQAVANVNTRFGDSNQWRQVLREVCENTPLETIAAVEEMTGSFQLVVVAPCTGNTIGKIANGITDTPVTMAVKAQLRNEKPVVLGISTNDGLGSNGRNIGQLLDKRSVYFVPFNQDNPIGKPRSLVSKFSLLPDSIENALKGKQIQPIINR